MNIFHSLLSMLIFPADSQLGKKSQQMYLRLIQPEVSTMEITLQASIKIIKKETWSFIYP